MYLHRVYDLQYASSRSIHNICNAMHLLLFIPMAMTSLIQFIQHSFLQAIFISGHLHRVSVSLFFILICIHTSLYGLNIYSLQLKQHCVSNAKIQRYIYIYMFYLDGYGIHNRVTTQCCVSTTHNVKCSKFIGSLMLANVDLSGICLFHLLVYIQDEI